jgi:hypothetical protein
MENIYDSSELQEGKNKKKRVKDMVSKLITLYNKQYVPINSSKSQRVLELNSKGELNSKQRKIKSNEKTTKRKSVEYDYTPGSKNISTCYIKNRTPDIALNKKSVDSLKPFNTTKRLKECCVKTVKAPILNKYKILFEDNNDSNCNKLLKTHCFSKNNSILKLGIEKNLHQEYMKDRMKGKLNKYLYIPHKTVWRPDSFKTLRKAEKLISSLPRTRN